MTKIRKVLCVTGKVALWFLAILVAYVAVGTILSLIPVNCNAVPGGDVVIYLQNNGAHTDIVVPTRTERIDWSSIAPPCDTSENVKRAYIAIGWGAQDFYLNVPEWKDLTPSIAIKAISGTGGTALHTTYKNEPAVGADCRRLTLSSSQYDALVQCILSSGKRSESGAFIRIDHKGYGQSDAFYEGTGRYSPVFTCNTWANSALKVCGQKCCLWTFLPHPIFWKYPLENQ